MKKRINVGVAGGGGILWAHGPALVQAVQQGHCTIVAVAEPQADQHARIRTLFGDAVRICADYRELMAIREVEAVDILLPHDLHLSATCAAAGAGKHVLVEKVMGRSVAECDRMIAACEQAGVSLSVCHDRRYNPAWVALKKFVDSGALGEILYWRLDHNQDVQLPAGSWARSADRLGGGAIMSCLTHQIDALRWYGGEIRSVQCMAKVVPSRMEGETVGLINAGMASGAVAQLSINWFTRAYRLPGGLWYEMVHVCGTRGEAFLNEQGAFATLHDPDQSAGLALPEKPFGDDGKQRFVKLPQEEGSGHAHCIAEWLKLLRGEPAAFSSTGRDSRKTVEVAQAAYQALRQERNVALPLPQQ